jgi:hypothetical protein
METPHVPGTPGILANDGILCWEARLHKSVVVPHSPSMDALIHSKSTTSTPSTAETGVLPSASVSLLDEENSILAAVQKSLSSVKTEVFHQGLNGGGTHLDFSAMLTGLDDDTTVCLLPHYLVVTSPSALPLGIWSCPTMGAGALLNTLTQQLDSNTQAPFQALTSSILFNLFLQTAAKYPADMVTPMTPVAAVQANLLDGKSFVNSTARNIVYCATQSAAYHVWREHFLYSFTQKMYTFYHNYETMAQGCFTHSLGKKNITTMYLPQ